MWNAVENPSFYSCWMHHQKEPEIACRNLVSTFVLERIRKEYPPDVSESVITLKFPTTAGMCNQVFSGAKAKPRF
jgi:hypothetical protein